MDDSLLDACSRLTGSLQRIYPLVKTSGILAGFALIGASLLALKNRQAANRPVLPALAGMACGVLLASVGSFVDALTMAVFRENAPDGISSVSLPSLGGLEHMVGVAVAIVMVVGAYQVVKGLVLMREAAEGSRTFWPGLTHVLGGVLCINIQTFMTALGATFGGTLQDVISTIFSLS